MIRITDLWKYYGRTSVLRGLHLEVKRGETLVILGRSGVGKSVLLRQIIGLEKPDRGIVEVNGMMISHLKTQQLFPAVRNMGMLFQGSALFDSMNIEENTAFYLRQHGNPRTKKLFSEEEIRKEVAIALDKVGLDGIQKKMPADLSGGMRKRAALARLLVYRPSILLYDEPTTGLDPITAQQISNLITKTQKELQGTSIVVTHDVACALAIGDRLALHNEGRITHIDRPELFMKIDDPIIHFLRGKL